MAINFKHKLLVVFPTLYALGLGTLLVSGCLIAVGVATYSNAPFDQFLLPPMGWCGIGAPVTAVGMIMMLSSLKR